MFNYKRTFFVLFLQLALTFSAFGSDLFKYKGRVGFTQAEDFIVDHQLIDNGTKLLLIGQKYFQVWDVETSRLVSSAPHEIPQFAPKGFVSAYLLLGLPTLLSWRSYLVDPDSKWIMTIERPDEKRPRIAVVRDIATAKRIASIDLPNISIDYISFGELNDEIFSIGKTDLRAAIAVWDRKTFKLKRQLIVEEYKWHQFIRNGAKAIVGSGDSKILWSGPNIKQGDHLTLRDGGTGSIEKEFTAKDLKPRTAFQETTVTIDEKYLVSKRDDRIFVWEIDGDGQPKFEVAKSHPKEDLELISVVGGRHLVLSVDKKLLVYDLAGVGKPKYTLQSKVPDTTVRLVNSAKDGKYILVADGLDLFVLETAGIGEPIFKILRQSEKERFSSIGFTDENYLIITRVNRTEKKPERTEFYDPGTGKIIYDLPIAPGSTVKFTANKKYLYTEGLGATLVWNFAEQKAFIISLKTVTPSSSDSQDNTSYDNSPYNAESTELSPDEKYILRYGDDVVSVFDIETGNEIQSIFDVAKVKYDKKNKVKKSGLGNAGWAADGRIVYAFEGGGLFSRGKTVSFWARN
jgi:hypothetical protein